MDSTNLEATSACAGVSQGTISSRNMQVFQEAGSTDIRQCFEEPVRSSLAALGNRAKLFTAHRCCNREAGPKGAHI